MGARNVIGNSATDDESDQTAHTESQICQACDARGEMIDVLEDGGDGGEHQVQVAIGDGGKEHHEENNGRFDEKLNRASQSDQKELTRLLAMVMDRTQVGIARSLA